jgi:transcriptional regulator with XRE-family HTH domain
MLTCLQKSGIMMGMGDDWRRLGERIVRRRKALGMSQVKLAQTSGLGRSTIQSIEAGTASPERKTLRLIEETLRWREGSTTAVLAGGEPTEIDPDEDTEQVWQREPAAPGDLSHLIRNIVFEAAVGLAPDASAAQIRAVEERARRLAREAGYSVARERQSTHTEEDQEP